MRNFITDKTYIPACKVRKFLMLLIHSGLVYAILLVSSYQFWVNILNKAADCIHGIDVTEW